MSGSRPTPRISVLMTVLNPHPVYFPQAVRSILGQTLPDFELLIIEDPSPCPAEPLLRPFRDPRIFHHLNPQRTSLIQQKNQGLAAARGELVAMFDADDLAEPDRFEKQVRFLQKHPDVAVLGSQIRIIDGTGHPRGYRQFPLHHDAIWRALPSFVPLSQPSVMMRKDALLNAGGYCFCDYPVAEDYELWSRLACRGARFANHPEPLLRYRVHSEQMKRTHLRDTIRAILRVKQRYWRPHMDRWARARTWVEWAMLALPPVLVQRLFVLTQYRRHLTIASDSRESLSFIKESESDDAQIFRCTRLTFEASLRPFVCPFPEPTPRNGHRRGANAEEAACEYPAAFASLSSSCSTETKLKKVSQGSEKKMSED